MTKITINEALSLKKQVEKRKTELIGLRDKASVKEHYFSTNEKTIEPQYDMKLLDAKISKLEIWLYQIDASIKQINAITTIDVPSTVEELLSPIE